MRLNIPIDLPREIKNRITEEIRLALDSATVQISVNLKLDQYVMMEAQKHVNRNRNRPQTKSTPT